MYSTLIRNVSRFNLTLRLIVKADLYSKVSVGGVLGTVGIELSNGKSMNEIMNESIEGLNNHGTSEAQCYDVVKANSTSIVPHL